MIFSKSYTAPTATQINMLLSVLLSMLRHTSENYPQLYSGSLFGFEDDEGLIDITHAYPFHMPDQYEGGLFRSRFGQKYYQEIQDTLAQAGYGVEFQGWFQLTVSGNFVTTQLVDASAQQQLANKNAFLIVHNLASVGKELELTALRLTQNFIEAYLDNKWKAKDLEEHRLLYLNIFEEVDIVVHNMHLVNLYLANEGGSQAAATTEQEFQTLHLSSNQNVTAQLLESLYLQVDSYNYDQNNFNYYQRLTQKENSKINQWKQQRKLENLERTKRGEPTLDTEEWRSLFKPISEPPRYNNMLHSHAIDVLADDILKKCDEELTKSFAIEKKLKA